MKGENGFGFSKEEILEAENWEEELAIPHVIIYGYHPPRLIDIIILRLGVQPKLAAQCLCTPHGPALPSPNHPVRVRSQGKLLPKIDIRDALPMKLEKFNTTVFALTNFVSSYEIPCQTSQEDTKTQVSQFLLINDYLVFTAIERLGVLWSIKVFMSLPRPRSLAKLDWRRKRVTLAFNLIPKFLI